MLDVKVLAMGVVETHIMRLYCNTMLYYIQSCRNSCPYGVETHNMRLLVRRC